MGSWSLGASGCGERQRGWTWRPWRAGSGSCKKGVLPLPGPSAPHADLVLFARDLFARLQIGSINLNNKALDSLLRFLASDPTKLAPLVAAEGDLPSLVRLLDPSAHSLIRDQATAAVSLLATTFDASRRAVFEEGVVGPLFRLLDSGPLAVRDRAAAAIEAITVDPANAWAVSAYGGVPILIAACRSGSGSPSVQALAAPPRSGSARPTPSPSRTPSPSSRIAALPARGRASMPGMELGCTVMERTW